MKDDNCIFCKLACGDIPANVIYEDKLFTVIPDASPATRGHALILPKTHAANIYELPDEYASGVFVLAKKMAAHMTEVLKCDGFNVVQNNGEVAGQTVFHFHMHLIPRWAGDGNEEKLGWNHADLSADQIAETAGLLDMRDDKA
ncbi:MAG: HIT family protein [Lachnospiraceae bacterium]|nr:HIT family protein [Lachnospiraceae bacterium]